MDLLLSIVRFFVKRLLPYSAQMTFEYAVMDIRSKSVTIMGIPSKWFLLQVMIALPCVMLMPVVKFTITLRGHSLTVLPTGVIVALIVFWPLVKKLNKILQTVAIHMNKELRFLRPVVYDFKLRSAVETDARREAKIISTLGLKKKQ